MPPIPQEHSPPLPKSEMPQVIPAPLDGEDIVITGLSGLFPACYNVKEFSEKLYKNENLVSSKNPRWNCVHPDLTKHIGNVPDLDKFDAQYFMVHYHLAHGTDVMTRKLLEQAYQAIFDSGTSPNELSGKNVGVFIATSLTETEKLLQSYADTGTGLVGCNRAMFSNRISYWLNAKGPSITIDASCSGSMVCLEKAYEAMRRGDCEAAIVGGCNVHLHPHSCMHYGRMFGMNPDGKTKCFDKNSDGQSPSECISVIFLQKAKYAKRVYASICNVKTQYSLLDTDYAKRYGPYRDSSVLSSFYQQFYDASNSLPQDVEYVEAFGAAYPEADKKELEAIETVFCKNRIDPLYVGSVMSNMGFSNAATTAAALTKVCLAYQTGIIPANLHYVTPHDDIPAICDGRMRVVTQNTNFARSYAAINNLSLTGINGHILLKGQYKPKDMTRCTSKIPYLITASGRQESGVERIFEDLKSNPIDPEVNALFHDMQKYRVSKHLARGYAILDGGQNKKTECLKQKVDYYDDGKKPLWFVYSGMGSQWNGMGRELMHIPVFAAAIKRCQEVLKPKGVDVIHIITTDDKKIFENILNSFVGISAVQIGLTDVLLSMGLVPDYIIGHSMGEMGCAYADGCVTAEEMILAAYYRGITLFETPCIKGTMVAVGLGWQQIKPMCPPEVQVACHNSAESCTLSGPFEIMREFVDKLNEQGIFARAVNSSNFAFHSRYIEEGVPVFLKYLKMVIKTPKQRSPKWLSTSVPKENWDEPAAKMNSAEYHANNMRATVLFEEAAEAIPDNAVLIEVAPHGLLQAILKRSLPNCTNVPLTRRGHPDSAVFLLEAVGELYLAGYNPDISVLYPKVEFPVSTETRSLSHMVEWVHSEQWRVPGHVNVERVFAAAYDPIFSTYDDECRFLMGHIINDETVFPVAGALVFAWDTLAMAVGVKRKNLSVQFNDVHIYAQPLLFDHRLMKFGVQIQRGTGKFEIVNENILVATGYIQALSDTSKGLYTKQERETSNEILYTSNDIYSILYDKGYDYRGEFRSIENINNDITRATVSWNENWVTLIDSAIQINVLRRGGDVVERPRFIQQLNIDIKMHSLAFQTTGKGKTSMEAYHFKDERITRCGGVLLNNILFTSIPDRRLSTIGVKTLKFVPHNQLDVVDISTALFIMLQILAENIDSTLYALDVTDENIDSLLCKKIKEVQPDLFNIRLRLERIRKSNISSTLAKETKAPDFILADNLLKENTKKTQMFDDVIPSGTFVLVLEVGVVSHSAYKVVASAITPNGRLVLGRWKPKTLVEHRNVISVASSKDMSQVKLAREKLSKNCDLCILTHYPPMKELKELVKQWRKDSDKNEVYLAMVTNTSSNDLQAMALTNGINLVYNVLHQGVWGGYYFIPEEPTDCKKIRGVSLTTDRAGDPDSLHWAEAPKPKPEDIVVSVHYTGLNLYDAKKCIGDVSTTVNEVSKQSYGMDFSGLTASGERVMGVVRDGAASSEVPAESTLLWPVPGHWTLKEAATVPLAYAHALYCLGIKCKLYSGMSVLVQGAAGALGQAVIAIALANKCTVFAGVSNMKKKQLLRRIFPELPDNHIGNSRHQSFGDMVLTATEGNGCDIVISCMKGGLKNISLNCCAAWGTTLDTQTIHSKEAYTYSMYNMTKCRSYIATDFSAVFEPANHAEREQLQVMVSEGIANGFVRPLSHVTFGAHESARAMRLLATSQHFGRVLLRIHGESFPTTTKRLAVRSNYSHLVVSATTDHAVTIRVVDLLIRRGAINIVLHILQNTAYDDALIKYKMGHWQKQGANVNVTFEAFNNKLKYEELITASIGQHPIDGLFVIVDCSSDKEAYTATSLLENLDEVTRKNYTSMRMFGVVSSNADIGRDICMRRALDGLPSVMLQLPKINKFNKSNKALEKILNDKNSVLLENLMPVFEIALCSSEAVVAVHIRKFEKNLIKEIFQVARQRYEGNDHITIKELDLSNEQKQDVMQLLQKHELVVSRESVPELTIAQLKNLQENLIQSKSKVTKGLEVLISSIDNDELVATSELIFFPTLAQNSKIRGDEFDSNATFLVMIPGIDGQYKKFESVCERLKLSAAVVQPGLDHIHETISETARRLVKVILKRICPREKFYLLGYSFGVLIALKMAAILEDHGLTGVVYCVDASPDTFHVAIETWLREAGITNAEELQSAIVQHTHVLLTGSKSEQLTLQLQEAATWNDKVVAGIRALRNRIPHSSQYVRAVMEAAYARITQAQQCEPNQFPQSLRSQIVLLRSHSNPHTSSDLGLAHYSERIPHVYELMEDHATALDDLRCPDIINRHLDEQTLADFDSKSLCNTYIYNSSTHSDNM